MKHYRLNKQKFKAFCINSALSVLGCATFIGVFIAILMSPEW